MRNPAIEKKLASLAPEELARVYEALFTTEAGQIVLEDLKARSFCFMPSVLTPQGGFNWDPVAVGFNEGARSTVLHIETQIYIAMTVPPPAPKKPEGENDHA